MSYDVLLQCIVLRSKCDTSECEVLSFNKSAVILVSWYRIVSIPHINHVKELILWNAVTL